MQEPDITPDLIESHGLTPQEYDDILRILDRTPTFTELGIFSAMWNEHCSYKSSKKWLRTLPTTGSQVICGPGENAGIVDIGDGQAVVFKMESHNHPSYLDPYHGAATGIGGILRDVFTMGARPFAAMNALSFGTVTHPKTAELVREAVAGMRDYAGTVGVPTVGGELRFHAAYDGNCLVNAFAAGLVDTDSIFYSAASGVGMPVVYLGAQTGRDGVGGATMASAEFDEATEAAPPTVQQGDPETERRLMEATLELMATGAVIAIQDMGAAGLTCSAVEMGDKGGLGMKLMLDKVPQRDADLNAYEMMLSETQERMLMVLRPEKEAEARAIFEKWDLHHAVIGETTADDRFIVLHNNETKADLPLSTLAGSAPEYDREWEAPAFPEPLEETFDVDPIEGLRALVGSPNYCSRQWVIGQLENETAANLLRRPGHGAGIARVPGSDKLLAFTSDVTPRYVAADPLEGGKQAVAEAWRNLTATGAVPLACTDNLNFGNPERPEIMGQLVSAIRGIGAACLALDMPVVSGNVSLYNETDGRAILPTPSIGAVGLLADESEVIGHDVGEGHQLLLIGETEGHLGQSALLAEMFGREEGTPPPVDLAAERRNGDFIRENRALIRACTDLADGGLALAAFELAEPEGLGVTLDPVPTALLFGEDQARYLVSCDFDQAEMLMIAAGNAEVPITCVGRLGGKSFRVGKSEAPMAELSALYRSALEDAIA
ncbi:phosphoribosylformylglycinamidine synthase subunit PurL [Pontibaca methylaminivorans]|uniref:phosphoribosylformylglycinamidine synthase subunit PurL n=1 Tax=Pontibaca methylaminivorans TaxID=515897 RepID=UPI002FD96DB8